MTKKVRVRDKNSSAQFTTITDSVITLFPQAVKLAAGWVTDPEGEEMRQFLYDRGATKEGLLEAVRFYDRYFTDLLSNDVKRDPYEAFQDADLKPDDPSFIAFQSVVAASVMSLYHDIVVDLVGEVADYSDTCIKNCLDFFESRTIEDHDG